MEKMKIDDMEKEKFHSLCDTRDQKQGCNQPCFSEAEHDQWFVELSQYNPENLIDFLNAIGYDFAKDPGAKIVDGTYTSVWDGEGELTAKARINLLTKEVTILESYCPGEVFNEDGEPMECEHLEDEYVTVNGRQYPCMSEAEYQELEGESAFWYR